VRRCRYRTVRISTVLVVRYRISASHLARSRPGARLRTGAHVWTPGGVPFGVVWNPSPLQRCIPGFAALVCRFRRPLSVYRDGTASLWAGSACSVYYWDGSDYDRCSVHGFGDATPHHRVSKNFLISFRTHPKAPIATHFRPSTATSRAEGPFSVVFLLAR